MVTANYLGSMVRRKRSASMPRKRTTRKAKKARKVAAAQAPGRSMMVHKFSRYVEGSHTTNLVIVAPATGAGFARTFALSDVNSHSEFTTLYDQYRLTGVMCYVQLLNNPDSTYYLQSGTAGNASNFYPRIWWSEDRDDSTTPTLDELKQRQGAKSGILQPNKMMKIWTKPSILIQTWGASAITTGYEPRFSWIDMANPSVQHFGMKFFVDFQGLTSVTNYLVRFDYKYFFECKQPR